MVIGINTKDMTQEEWLAERQNGIGGSDIGTILGLNKWKSAYQLWLEKTGQVAAPDLSDNEAVYWGHTLEDTVAKEFERRSGKKVRRRNVMFCDDEFSFLRANVDREVVGENAVFEAKTTGAHNESQWDDGEVPASYLLQCQWYMMVKGYERAYIACLIGGNNFVFREIERDEELIEMIKTAAIEFWENNVQGGEEPAVTHLDKDSFKHLTLIDDEIDLSEDLDFDLDLLADIKKEEKKLEKERKQIEARVKQRLQGHAKGVTSKYTIKLSHIIQNRVDSKRLKAEHEEIYNACLKESKSERLTIKEVL